MAISVSILRNVIDRGVDLLKQGAATEDIISHASPDTISQVNAGLQAAAVVGGATLNPTNALAVFAQASLAAQFGRAVLQQDIKSGAPLQTQVADVFTVLGDYILASGALTTAIPTPQTVALGKAFAALGDGLVVPRVRTH